MYYSGETKILKANCIKYRPHLELLRVWRGLNGVTSAELRDSRNSLLYGVPESLLRKIQSVQDATARLVTSTRRRDHITPVLHRLHWLPVQRRVEFKIACLVHHQLLASTAPRRTCLPTFDSSSSMTVLIADHLPTGHWLPRRRAPR